jgi:hypothetical protein
LRLLIFVLILLSSDLRRFSNWANII